MTAVPYFCCLGVSKNVDFFFSSPALKPQGGCFQCCPLVFYIGSDRLEVCLHPHMLVTCQRLN